MESMASNPMLSQPPFWPAVKLFSAGRKMSAWGDFHSVAWFWTWAKNLSKLIATYPPPELVIPKWWGLVLVTTSST